MPYASLRDFMTQLEARGRLVRVTEPVATTLEMTEIQTRLLAEGGPAVPFENTLLTAGRPRAIPVLATLFGPVDASADPWGEKYSTRPCLSRGAPDPPQKPPTHQT